MDMLDIKGVSIWVMLFTGSDYDKNSHSRTKIYPEEYVLVYPGFQ